MLYAIPTISLSTITYIYCGNMVKTFAKISIVTFEVRTLKRRTIRKLNLKTFLLQLLLCVVFILIFTSFNFMSDSMNLSFVDSFYFTMSTLLTIGFGDIVFDLEYMVNNVHVFLIGNVIFIFGLGTMASLIASMCDLRNKEAPLTEFLKKTTKRAAHKIELGRINEAFNNKRSAIFKKNKSTTSSSKTIQPNGVIAT